MEVIASAIEKIFSPIINFFPSLLNILWNIFNPILLFFQQIWDYISRFFVFLWDLISWLYYWFNTIISHLWGAIENILWYNFIWDNSFVLSNLASLLWITPNSLFIALFLTSILLVVFRFIYSLIPFFKK